MTSKEIAHEVYKEFSQHYNGPMEQKPEFESIYELYEALRNERPKFKGCNGKDICLYFDKKSQGDNMETNVPPDITRFALLLCLIVVAFVAYKVYEYMHSSAVKKSGAQSTKRVQGSGEHCLSKQGELAQKDYLFLATEMEKFRDAFPDFDESKLFVTKDMFKFRGLPWYFLPRQDENMLRTVKQQLSQNIDKSKIVFSVMLKDSDMRDLDKDASDSVKRRGVEALADKGLSFMGTIDELADVSQSFYLRN